MKNCTHEYHWFLSACNETGWKCVSCDDKPGEPEGFSPQLDRSHTYHKVGGILNDLHDQEFVHVSNGTGGDQITELVAAKCHETGRFDQDSILLFLMQQMNHGNGKYWKEVSESIIAGRDNRERCQCGRLARIFTSDEFGKHHYCSSECETTFERQMTLLEAIK